MRSIEEIIADVAEGRDFVVTIPIQPLDLIDRAMEDQGYTYIDSESWVDDVGKVDFWMTYRSSDNSKEGFSLAILGSLWGGGYQINRISNAC